MIVLVHIADLLVTVGEPIEVGQTAAGFRRLIPITGGVARGPEIRGSILPGGADFQIIRHDGVAELHARYAIRTEDGAVLYIENNGLRHGPAEAMERLRRGEPVEPGLIYFRSAPRFETGAVEYQWLARHLFVAEGVRRPDCVELAIYRID
jgi:hypothetical protein